MHMCHRHLPRSFVLSLARSLSWYQQQLQLLQQQLLLQLHLHMLKQQQQIADGQTCGKCHSQKIERPSGPEVANIEARRCR